MVLLELFSGIGGFSKGMELAGYSFDKVYFSEINEHAIANFKYNFPHAEHIGSVTEITGADIEHPNIITFGSPCQNFSAAGDGTGLQGSQSSLIKYAINAIGHFRPDVFIWENVKGVLFAKHRTDFFAILQAFSHIGGYRLEWQLLNTKWFLPQNRERIYLVGRLAKRCTGNIFPICPKGKEPSSLNDGKVPICGTLTKSYAKQPNLAYYVAHATPAELYKAKIHSIDFTKIRMLTEVECERLQGFPDDFTRFGNYDGKIKEIARFHRYEMLGNAVSVPVVRSVAEKVKENTDFTNNTI